MEKISRERFRTKWIEGLQAFTANDYSTLYVNIPYCVEHCEFCLYYRNSFRSSKQIDVILDQVEEEANVFADIFESHAIKAVYIGGGTPSLLDSNQIVRLKSILVDRFKISTSDDSFRCFEAHPAYLTEKKIAALLADGFFNRISFGIQSFDRLVLEKTGRIFVSEEKLAEVVSQAKTTSAGRKLNINVDLMIGLDGESIATITKSFDILARLQIPRIAIYCNRRKNASQGESFRAYALEVISYLERYVAEIYPSYGLLNGYPLQYNEAFAWGIKSQISDRVYRYFYNSSPIDYNNNLGLGLGSSSHIIPTEEMYWKSGSEYTQFGNVDYERIREKRTKSAPLVNEFNY